MPPMTVIKTGISSALFVASPFRAANEYLIFMKRYTSHHQCSILERVESRQMVPIWRFIYEVSFG
jgi:hypothetical protein